MWSTARTDVPQPFPPEGERSKELAQAKVIRGAHLQSVQAQQEDHDANHHECKHDWWIDNHTERPESQREREREPGSTASHHHRTDVDIAIVRLDAIVFENTKHQEGHDRDGIDTDLYR